MKIVSFRAENIKRLSVVEIKPDGSLVEITGKNKQGKTSVLDSIWWALTGTSNVQKSPIRSGCEEALIQLDLGKLKVKRTFTAKEGGHTTTLEVRDADGNKFAGGQKMLDAIYGELTFDPLYFTEMKPREQFDAMKAFVPGIDFDAIDEANDKDFKARTVKNVSAKELRTRAAAIVVPETVGERVDETALVDELENAGAHNADIVDRSARRDAAGQQIAQLRQTADEKVGRATELRRQAEALDEEAARHEEEAKAIQAKLDSAPPLPAPIDTSAVRAKIESARATNAAVDVAKRAADELAALTSEATRVEAEAQALTDAMNKRTADKAAAVAAAKIPVAGISFGEGAILLNGVPFDQASDAEQLSASVAIAAAMNPRLRIIRVREGSKLDTDSMAQLEALASASDMQIWVETVASDRAGAIVMEDGHVKGAVQQAAE